ncbi:Dihydrolipoamide dehydrogenase [Pseudonocardia sp. Ae168_Ps1]|nr:Dihydrolipoamide dehydrogenase [Pseudonocardia sp. Ae150A_Ps1]OLL78078.1 Dihydrolipoamide dehydrogenase [Pseudonocardia sp. Ae168_Ps1]OLL87798.1 Dihydrolipoamide dehydrogenase [Pseudonocardia sp. Ae263_Ps1]OLL92176.1 Dihydrolipoamide dehydrogenase [Pseudonocardia sp. Ae356_Ps1]
MAVIEEKYWGGVCLNVGCIPSKALLRNAEIAHIVTKEQKTFGLSGEVSLDFGAAFDRSRTVADGRVKGVHFLMKKNKITELDGFGRFTKPGEIEVELSKGGNETVTYDDVIIAAGSTVKLLPGTELSERVVTYEEQILTRELPESVIIAGAGAIGVEFAFVLANYGVDVTIVEYLDRLLPLEDADVSKELLKTYKKLGVTVRTSTKVESITDDGSGVTVSVSSSKGNEDLRADKVVQAIGFAPRVDGYGLDKLGVSLTQRGAIEIDDHMRTNVDHVYAIGDVTAKLMLAHVAEAQGIVAAETLAGAETQELDYKMMPRATFCNPQVASFGWTEAEARDLADEKGWKVNVATFPFTANGKAHGMAEPAGFVKLISDDTHGELLGGHIIGAEATELLPELTLAQKWDLTVHEMARNVHAHPTLSECLQEAIHGLSGHMINF